MNIKEIRAFSNEELVDQVQQLRRRVFELRAQSVTEKLEDTTAITKVRRDIARLLTVQRERARQAS